MKRRLSRQQAQALMCLPLPRFEWEERFAPNTRWSLKRAGYALWTGEASDNIICTSDGKRALERSYAT